VCDVDKMYGDGPDYGYYLESEAYHIFEAHRCQVHWVPGPPTTCWVEDPFGQNLGEGRLVEDVARGFLDDFNTFLDQGDDSNNLLYKLRDALKEVTL